MIIVAVVIKAVTMKVGKGDKEGKIGMVMVQIVEVTLKCKREEIMVMGTFIVVIHLMTQYDKKLSNT